LANELTNGTRRVGDFIDFDPDTPKVKVVLENSDQGIGITIPWSNDEDPYASWFLRDIGVAQAPPYPVGPPVPKRVLFSDSYGSVLLIGCRARGFHTNLMGPGAGTLWARAAVMGVDHDVDFENPHGLRTDISGLRTWLGVSSWSETWEYAHKSVKATVRSVDVPDIEVGEYGGLNLSIRFSGAIRREEESGQRVLLDFARCETRSDEQLNWEAHLKLHHAVRDLLVLSRWYDESCVESFVLHFSDPNLTLDGKYHGKQWRTVVMPNTETRVASEGRMPYLIKYSDLEPAGLLRWIALRDEYARALDPVISSIRLRGATPNTLLAHTGPGLEALGYLLMLRDGCLQRDAARAPLKSRFKRISKDLGSCLPFEVDEWVNDAVRSYNGLKHANRSEPDTVDLLNAWRKSVLVARAWVAAELGIPVERLKERFSNDPQRHPYVKDE